MKKTLYIVCIIAILILCWSVAYYFITKANIDKQSFDIQNNEYIKQKDKDCLEEFRKYYDYNNYNKSGIEDDWVWYDFYRVDDIRYSTKSNSCIQFWYWATTIYEGNTVYEYKITDETNRTNIYYCSHSETYSTNNKSKEECEKWYNEKLQDLWIK